MGPIVAQGLAAFTATLIMFEGGMIFGWTSPSLPKLLEPEDDTDLKITEDESSWIVSITSVGCVIGQILISLLVDRVGRKWSLNILVIPILAGWLILGLATIVEIIYIGRLMGGIAAGAAYGITPMYLGEIADDKIRGALGSLLGANLNGGMLLSYSIGPWVSRQMLSVVSAIPAILFVCMNPWLPETPHFLVMKGSIDKARKSLIWLRRRDDVEEELTAMELVIMEEQSCRDKVGIMQLVRSPINRKALGIVLGILTAQQFSGAIAILSYGSLIFESSGLVGWGSLSVIIMGLVTFSSGIGVMFVVDIAGRRPTLLFSSIGVSIFLIGEGIFFHLKDIGYETSAYAWTPLVCMIGYYLCFVPGLGSMPFVVTTELFPTNVKASANMVVSVYGSVLGVIIAKLYQAVSTAIGSHWMFYFFAGSSILGILFIYFYVPETKKLSLEDIQKKLNSGLTDSNVAFTKSNAEKNKR